MVKILFCQFSDKLHNLHDITREYYERVYSKMPGYHLPEHFFEIPYWIPRASALLGNDKYQKEVHVITDIDQTVAHINEGGYDCVLFSVLTVNERRVHEIVSRCSAEFILGGYTDPKEFEKYPNVRYLGSLEELSAHFDVTDGKSPDYSLFEGLECIPRVTLSEGCLYRCNFCTAPLELRLVSDEDIAAQAKGFRPLKFQLVYIDDRTFGQASNHDRLSLAEKVIRSYNDDFLGFIVQTTPNVAANKGVLERWERLSVKYIELGVETIDDRLLRWLNKPHRKQHVDELCGLVRKNGKIKIIPNILVCIPDYDYQDTIRWIADNRDIIPAVNIFPLSIYFGSQRGRSFIKVKKHADSDDSDLGKSWLKDEEVRIAESAIEDIYDLFK